MYKHIVIDAGHGINTPGKRCLKSLDLNETREWTLNDSVANFVINILESYECSIYRSDDISGNTDVSVSERAKYANSMAADLFISIHHNAGLNGLHGGGVVICYYPTGTRKSEAETLYNYVTNSNGNVGNRVQKLQSRSDLTVLSGTKCPAFLVENGFMDSVDDVPKILDKTYQYNSARGIAEFIIDYLDLQPYVKTTVCPYCGK